jgi:pimeloyl-ACP methyl ester carboxylesterase
MLPGLFSTSFSYRKIIPLLSDSSRVIALDYPGIGLSEKPDWVYSHRRLAYFVNEFINEITDERVHLVAYDYGAAISFLLLNEYPEKLKTLTLISPFQNLQRIRYYSPLFFLNKRYIGNLVSMTLGKKSVGSIYNKYLVSKSSPLTEDIIEDYMFLLLHGQNRVNYIQFCQNIDRSVYAKNDMESGMKKMVGGRQILLGNQDRMIYFKELENIKQYIRLSFTQNINGGRLLMEDSPQDCASKIENLVKTFSRKS